MDFMPTWKMYQAELYEIKDELGEFQDQPTTPEA